MANPKAPAPSGDDPGHRTGDWPAQAADTIVDLVGTARQKTTGPALTAARGVVYGVIILVIATMALVVLVAGTVRLLNNWLDVWLTYLILGVLCLLGGALMFRRARADAEADDLAFDDL